MSGRVLVAGIGNIFQGDDAFGVAVAQKLALLCSAPNVRVMEIGIRSLDLAFALLDDYALTILVDTTARGNTPGTLYTILIEPADIPDSADESCLVNSHGLDPVRVLALAKSLGAHFNRVLLVGCEPEILDCDDSGHIGLSAPVELAVEPALGVIRQLIQEFTGDDLIFGHPRKEEVYSNEHA